MLIISRKLDESIRIGDDISIMVVKITGDKLKLDIKAPRDVLVLRSELLLKDNDRPSWEERSCL